MGFLDWLTGKKDCPRCETSGAKEVNGVIQCPNPACAYFRGAEGAGRTGVDAVEAEIRARQAAADPPAASRRADINSSPTAPAGAIAIHYRNFQGAERTFFGRPSTAYRVDKHIVIAVEPRGAKISLARDRIHNLRELEDAFPRQVAHEQDWPTPRERQVLSYHKKHGTTSALHQRVLAKYPNW